MRSAEIHEMALTVNWWHDVISSRVHMGAMALDNNVRNWERLVNLDMLDMSDDRSCVLAYVFGSYFAAPEHLFGNVMAFGFDRYTKEAWDGILANRPLVSDDGFEPMGYPTINEEYALLKRYWVKAIEARRASATRLIPDGFTESLGF